MYKIIGADGKEYGPVTAEQLRQWRIEGRVNAQTRILLDGATEWRTLGDHPEFNAPPVSGQPPQPISPPATQPLPFHAQRINSLAVTGLILGIISIVLSCCCWCSMPLNLIGLVLSAVSLMQINKRPDLYSGRSVAIAGLIISGLSLLLGIGVMILGATVNWDEITQKLENL